ncbi:histidinol-phosphate transaminase [Aquiluna sp. Uisw_065]|uniref:histidinol-phosphate transaminase n=1 Tax=Aquiluna sp. Uisw_065 TaxID=3230967 RepID=UPI0039E9FAEC
MTNLDDLPIRRDLVGQLPYGAPQIDVPIRLNVNENTFGIPEEVALKIVQRTAEAALTLNRYPDREFIELRRMLAEFLGGNLAAEQIWAANGSNEILQQFFQVFGGPDVKAISFGPTYSMYLNIARTTLTEYQLLPRLEDYSLTEEYVRGEILKAKPQIVILCSPNNPTGTGISLDVIEAAYDSFEGMLLVDEAYQEFANSPSAISLLPGRPRLVISRTMSKAFAFAGARVGYMAADAAVVDAMRIVRLPYHLSALTQAAAMAALETSGQLLANVQQIKVQRDRIMAGILKMGLRPLPSDANFVLIEGFSDTQMIFDGLLSKGIIVRDIGIAGCLRVTAGTEAETTKLLGELALLLD